MTWLLCYLIVWGWSFRCIAYQTDKIYFVLFFGERHNTISDLSFVSADIKSESYIIAFLNANGCSLSTKLGKKAWNFWLTENCLVVTLRGIKTGCWVSSLTGSQNTAVRLPLPMVLTFLACIYIDSMPSEEFFVCPVTKFLRCWFFPLMKVKMPSFIFSFMALAV